MKVSVIIPIYNTEKYLCRCIDSVLNQTFDDYEILLIDDGSTDDSASICYEYAQRHNKIKAIYSNHLGVASARNLGLKLAKGKYIMFCDSDDYAEPNWIQTLYETLDKNPESSVLCAYSSLNIQKKSENKVTLTDVKTTTHIDISEYYYIYINNLSAFLWNKIYRHDVIKQNHIVFRTNLLEGEDLLFNIDYLKHIKDFVFIPESLYHWVDNNVYTLSRVFNPYYFDVLKEFYFPRLSIISDKDKQAFYDNSFYRFYTSMEMVFDERNKASRREKIKYCNYILRSDAFIDATKHAGKEQCNNKLKFILKFKNFRLLSFVSSISKNRHGR